MEFKELDSLDFSVHQLNQSLKSILALLFTRNNVNPLLNQLDQLKCKIGLWGLERESAEEIICAISHIQKAIEIEDKLD